jgi:hypothetical protein
MKRLWLIAILFAGIIACKASRNSNSNSVAPVDAINTLTDKEKAEGWILLFDGTSKKGWHIWHDKSDGSSWTVQDGLLHRGPLQKVNGKSVGGGDIVSDAAFTNFQLSVEWKISDSGNSGIIFLVQEDPKYEFSFQTGPEMQVLDNNGHPDSKYPKHRAGDLYDLVSSSQETVKKVGEWNKAEVIFNKGLLELFLNSVKVVSTRLDDENWQKLKASSKFKNLPDFAAVPGGHIALQDHGNEVWFRNIKIRPL